MWFTFEKSERYRDHFINGFFFGFFIYAFLFYWIPDSISEIANLNVLLSYILGVAGFAGIGCMYGFLFMVIKFLWRKAPWLIPFVFPGFEWLCLPVFPISLGYSWRASIGGVQVADIGGVYFLSGLCCLYSYLIYLGVRNISKRKQYWAAVLILIMVQYSYGIYRIFTIQNSPILSNLTVSVLQTGIAPIDKRDDTTNTFNLVIAQLKEAVIQNKEAQVFVLPESIFVPSFKNQEDLRLQELRSTLNKNQALLFGCNTQDGEKYYNSMGYIQSNNDQFLFYQKQKLLLLGEYLPFMKFTPQLSEKIARLTHTNEFNAGESNISFSYNTFKVFPFICIESMYGSWVAEVNNELKNTDLLVNISEDGWFGTSKASALHLYANSLRPIEMRKPLVRCVNVGYSSFINEWGNEKLLTVDGQEVKAMDPSMKYHFVAKVEKRQIFSFYAWGGYIFEFIIAGLFLSASLWFVLAMVKNMKIAK